MYKTVAVIVIFFYMELLRVDLQMGHCESIKSGLPDFGPQNIIDTLQMGE